MSLNDAALALVRGDAEDAVMPKRRRRKRGRRRARSYDVGTYLIALALAEDLLVMRGGWTLSFRPVDGDAPERSYINPRNHAHYSISHALNSERYYQRWKDTPSVYRPTCQCRVPEPPKAIRWCKRCCRSISPIARPT